MTDEQAMALMMTDGFQTRAEAEGKLQRAKLSSTQLPTYYVGTSEWWHMRRAYEAAKGKDFTLAEFHDRAWMWVNCRFRGWERFCWENDGSRANGDRLHPILAANAASYRQRIVPSCITRSAIRSASTRLAEAPDEQSVAL